MVMIKFLRIAFFSSFLFAAIHTLEAQKVYITEYNSHADVKVFITKNYEEADLVIFKVRDEDAIGENEGLWFFCEEKKCADKIIYYVKFPKRAEMTVFFTYERSLAGWKNESKKFLMY